MLREGLLPFEITALSRGHLPDGALRERVTIDSNGCLSCLSSLVLPYRKYPATKEVPGDRLSGSHSRQAHLLRWRGLRMRHIP